MKNFWRNEDGSVAIMSAFALTAIVLVCAFLLEASSLYVSKLEAQRVADIVNLAAANTNKPIVGNAPSAQALATAKQMATLNGLGSADIVTTVTTGASGQQELTTMIEKSALLQFGQLLVDRTSVAVDGLSSAFVGFPTGDCIRSLNGPVNIYNNAVVDGPSCNLSATTYLYVCGQADVTASAVEVRYTQSQEKPKICGSDLIRPGFEKFAFNKVSVDPLADDIRVKAIEKRLKAMSKWPYGSTIPRKPFNLKIPMGNARLFSNTISTLPADIRYGEISVENSTLTFTGSGAADTSCVNPTTISGNLLLSGKNRLIFNSGCYAVAGYVSNSGDTRFETAVGAKVTFAFNQFITNGSGTLAFEDMAISAAGLISNLSGGRMTFGNGPFLFGAGIANSSGVLSFGDGPFYLDGGTMTNGKGKLSFGDGAFYLWGGSMKNASTGEIVFGNGPFTFYGGTVTNDKGTLTFGRGSFEFQGGSLALNEGSTTNFGVGDVNFYGGTAYFHGKKTTFGGVGDALNGASSLFFYGGSFSMRSQELQAAGTTFAFWGGSVSLLDIGTMNMTAPRSADPAYGYTDMLFYIYGGAFSLYQGAVTDTLSGIVYAPDTNISIYGKQQIQVPNDGCFQLIGGIVDIYQNSAAVFRPCGSGASVTSRVKITR